jgi:hypothetical protein
MLGQNLAIVVGANGVILRTSDAGLTWTSEPGTFRRLFGVCFIDSLHGTAVGEQGEILATSDGGIDWSEQISGIATIIAGVSFTDAHTGNAVGQRGRFLRTTTGGIAAVNDGLSVLDELAPTIESIAPCPVRDDANVCFSLDIPPARGQGESRDVLLRVTDILGREVSTSVRYHLRPGHHLEPYSTSLLPGGVYLCKISAGGTEAIRPFIVQR